MNVTLHYGSSQDSVCVEVGPSIKRYEVIEYKGRYFVWRDLTKGRKARAEGYYEAFGVKVSKQ